MSSSPVGKGNSSGHLTYLDSCRGIAALMVMVYHFIERRYADQTWGKVASILFNGSDAVSFFFVLSGFVLTYKYVHSSEQMDVRKFYISRFFRLWPAYFITVLLNALSWLRYDTTPGAARNVFLGNTTHFWEEAMLIKPFYLYFGAGWTLVIEMAFSFLMPFLVLIARSNPKALLWLLFAGFIMSHSMGPHFMFQFHFVLGVWLCTWYREAVRQSGGEFRPFQRPGLMLVIAMVLFSVRHVDRLFPFGSTYFAIAKFVNIDFFHYTGFASFIIIAWILSNSAAQRFLQQKVFVFFGKISYSIYLMHWLFVAEILSDQYSFGLSTLRQNPWVWVSVLFAIYCIITIVVSVLLYHLVERPFIRLGKYLTQKLVPSTLV